MDELTNEVNQAPVRRQRWKRSKFQIFKEAYLPFVIVLLAVILVITFIIGFAEEFLFRGVVQTHFGIVIASFVFAVLHIRYIKKPFLFLNTNLRK